MMTLQTLLWIDVALILLYALLLLRHLHDRAARYILLFLFSTLCYLAWMLDTEVLFPPIPRILIYGGVSLLSYFFWLSSLAFFQDDFKPGKIHILVGVLKLAVGYASLHWFNRNCDCQARIVLDSFEKIAMLTPMLLFSMGLSFHAILQAHSGEKDDLVEERVILRKIFVFLFGGLSLYILASYLIFRPLGHTGVVDWINAALMALASIAFAGKVLEFRSGIFRDRDVEAKKKIGPAYTEEREKLLEAFEKRAIYATEGLTIRILASKLEIPEYILRRVINRDLGFRNFNDFLNRYRIQRACELLDSGNQPVIRIAMDLGYSSPAPFNRAFRSLAGMTPSEYRKRGEKKDGPISKSSTSFQNQEESDPGKG